MFQERGLTGRSKPWDGIEHRAPLGLRTPLAMLRDREAVGLVAQVLQEVERLRGARKDERELLTRDPYLFEPLRQSHDGHVRTHSVQSGSRGIHLREATVRDDQVGAVGETFRAPRRRVDQTGRIGDAVLVLSFDARFLGQQSRKAPGEDFVHRARIIWRTTAVFAADVVGAVGVFARHAVLENHHRRDLVLTTRVRHVVALDAQRCRRQIKVLGELLERLRARRNVARPLRAVQGQGLPGILRHRLHELSLRTSLRHVHRHGRAAHLPQPARNRLLLLWLDGNEHLTRDRRCGRVRDVVNADGRHLFRCACPGLVRRGRGIHLLQEAGHEGGVIRPVDALDHPAARASNTPAAHMEDVYRRVQVIADERKHVRVRAIIQHDRVALQHRTQCLHIIAQLRRTLKVQLRRRLAHLLFQVTDDGTRPSLHELTQALCKLAMLLHRNAPHTRRRTLIDVAEQARTSLCLRPLEHARRA